MKKLLLLSFIILSTISYAGDWKVDHHNADELLDIPEYDSYIYGNGKFGVGYRTDNNIFLITYRNCVFDYEWSSIYDSIGEYVTIGLYNSSKELLEKGSVFMFADSDFDSLYISGIWSKKIISHLHTDGYIRIVASAYSCSDYDFTFPCHGR